MVGVVVDHDVIVVPIPVVNIGDIKGSDAERVVAEPKAGRPSASQPPHEARPETALAVAVLPRMIQVEAGVVRPLVVSDPFAVMVDVRGRGMSLLIAQGRVISRRPGRIL